MSDNVFFHDAELVIIEIRWTAEIVIGQVRAEKGIVLRTRGNAADSLVLREIGPEVAVGKGVRVDKKPDVLQVRRRLEHDEDLVRFGVRLFAVLGERTRPLAASFVEEDHGRLGLPVKGAGTHVVDFLVHVPAGEGVSLGGYENNHCRQ